MQNNIKIPQWLNTPFILFNRVENRILFVFGSLIFTILFLYLFVPFNINYWISYPKELEFLGLAGFGIIGFLVIAGAQILTRVIWKDRVYTRKHLILWFVLELFIITSILATVYGTATSPWITEFFATIKFSALIYSLWYLLGLSILVAINPVKSEIVEMDPKQEMINFRDENDKIKLSVHQKDLLYLESADNYVMIFYILDDGVGRDMIRTSLKKIHTEVEAHNIIRCHRSFMVNMQNVIFARKSGRNYELKLRHIDQYIPVSRNFAPQFKALLES